MPVFVGTHINKIDRKGRVSVPAPFRNAIGTPAGVYTMRSIRGVVALDAFTPGFIDNLAASISDPFDSEYEDFTSAFFGAATLLTFDAEGRIMLPEALRAFAGIEDQVCFMGRGQFFQIWEPEAGLAHQEQAFRRAPDNLPRLNVNAGARRQADAP